MMLYGLMGLLVVLVGGVLLLAWLSERDQRRSRRYRVDP